MRLALPIAIALLVAGLVAGCGSSPSTGVDSTAGGTTGPAGAVTEACGGGSVRVGGVACKQAEAVLAEWRKAPGCAIVGGASHASCQIRGYLCIAARQGRSAAVSCAQPGKSILFSPAE